MEKLSLNWFRLSTSTVIFLAFLDLIAFFIISSNFFDEAIWGGETENHGSQPQSLSDYFRVITFQSASKSGLPQEQINVLGNHLGVWDIGYSKSYNTQKLIFERLYIQTTKS